MRTKLSTIAITLTLWTTAALAQSRGTVPSVDDLISLKHAASPVISPDGRYVAYTVRETNWDDNLYKTEIWIADSQAGTTRQLTNSGSATKSSSAPAWSPDGHRLAFSSDRTDRRQIYLIDPQGGEGVKLTSGDEGAGSFKWSPDGRLIAYTATDPQTDEMKNREKKYGQFDAIDQDYRMTHLYVVDVIAKQSRRLTQGNFTVGNFDWSPAGKKIAFDHRINPALSNSETANISIVDVDSGQVHLLVSQAGPDRNPIWSPDGSQIAFESAMGSATSSYTNSAIAIISAAGGAIRNASAEFDENPSLVGWRTSGLYFSASQRTNAYLFRLDPHSSQVTRLVPAAGWIGSNFSLNAKTDRVAYLASSATAFPEIYSAAISGAEVRKLTDMGSQVAKWIQPTREVISWKSKDGTTIEGVLHKPADFKPGTKYPLLVVIHGGPTDRSRPTPFSSLTTYPIDTWLGKGAIVLEPNYRGSTGYGEKFRSLNVRNLGIGDAWDVLSGVDSLIAQGIVDPDRVGCMGWSQGGYISAFLSTHDSARFKAISVGAGISDWTTYYVSTDIHQFTRQYLKATPWEDPDIYAKTSPITYIKGAKTPTLIQHGATDQRVPLPDAYEFYQGLQDQHVPSKLIIYKGFEGVGHGPSKPKSSRAVMEHNLEWFDQYLFGTASQQQK